MPIRIQVPMHKIKKTVFKIGSVVNSKTMVFCKCPVFMSKDEFKSCPTDEKKKKSDMSRTWQNLFRLRKTLQYMQGTIKP